MSAFRTNYGSAFHGECTPSRFSHSIPATDGGSQTAILIAELLGALLVIELWQSVELFGELGKTPEFKLSHLAHGYKVLGLIRQYVALEGRNRHIELWR
jgi:hypothetical protein